MPCRCKAAIALRVGLVGWRCALLRAQTTSRRMGLPRAAVQTLTRTALPPLPPCSALPVSRPALPARLAATRPAYVSRLVACCGFSPALTVPGARLHQRGCVLTHNWCGISPCRGMERCCRMCALVFPGFPLAAMLPARCPHVIHAPMLLARRAMPALFSALIVLMVAPCFSSAATVARLLP